MRRIILSTVVVAGMLLQGVLTTPASAAAANPIFGKAKAIVMSTAAAKHVTAKGYTTATYLYYGMLYSYYAIYDARVAYQYNYYGSYFNGPYGYATTWAYYAYLNASSAAGYFYDAYSASYNYQ